MSKSLRIVLGIAISGVCLWLAFRQMAWNDLSQALQSAKWIWFLPITVVYLGAHVLRCFRWSALLSPVKKIKPLDLFPLLMLGFLVNNVLPARAGEVARAFATSKKTAIPTSTVLGSIAMERITDLIGLIAVMAIAIKVIPMDKLPLKQVALILLGGIIGLVALIMVVRKLQDKSTPLNQTSLGKIIEFLNRLIDGFAAIRSPLMISKIALLSLSIWMIEAVCLMTASRAFGLDLAFPQANALLSGISFGVMIPAAPGYIGTYEFFGKEMLKLLGYLPQLSLPFLLSFHFYQMLLTSVLGIPGLIRFGMPSKT